MAHSVWARALYDYRPMETSEVGLQKGELIEVTNQDDADWWIGIVEGNRKGEFPSNYVEIVGDEIEDDTPSPLAEEVLVLDAPPPEESPEDRWAPVWDDESHETYYWNTATNETKWTPPRRPQTEPRRIETSPLQQRSLKEMRLAVEEAEAERQRLAQEAKAIQTYVEPPILSEDDDTVTSGPVSPVEDDVIEEPPIVVEDPPPELRQSMDEVEEETSRKLVAAVEAHDRMDRSRVQMVEIKHDDEELQKSLEAAQEAEQRRREAEDAATEARAMREREEASARELAAVRRREEAAMIVAKEASAAAVDAMVLDVAKKASPLEELVTRLVDDRLKLQLQDRDLVIADLQKSMESLKKEIHQKSARSPRQPRSQTVTSPTSPTTTTKPRVVGGVAFAPSSPHSSKSPSKKKFGALTKMGGSPLSSPRSPKNKKCFGSMLASPRSPSSRHRLSKKPTTESFSPEFDENLPRVAKLSSSVSDKAQQAAKAEAVREIAAKAALRYSKCKTIVFAPDETSQSTQTQPSSTLKLGHTYHYSGEPWRKGMLGGRNAVWTCDGRHAVFPSAAAVVVHDIATTTQKFFFAKTMDETYSDVVSAVARHPFRNIIASGQAGKRPRCSVWELSENMRTLAELRLPAGSRYVSLVRFSPCGRLLVSLGADDAHTATFWDWERATPLASYRIGNAAVYGMEFHPFLVLDAKAKSARETTPLSSLEAGDAVFGLASCGARHLKFWAVSIVQIGGGGQSGGLTPVEKKHPLQHRCAWCVDAGAAVIGKHPEFQTVGFTAVAPALDGCYLVGTERGALSIWRQAREEAALILPPKGKCVAVFPEVHEGSVFDIAVSHAAGKVATAGKDGKVRLFSLVQGEKKKVNLQPLGTVIASQQAPCLGAPRSLAWDASETKLLVGTQGNALAVLEEQKLSIFIHGHVGRVTQVAASVNGIAASVGVDRTLRVWDTKSKRLAQLLRLPDRALSLAFHPAGTSLALGCDGGDLLVATKKSADKVGGWTLTSRRRVAGNGKPKNNTSGESTPVLGSADEPHLLPSVTPDSQRWGVTALKYSPDGTKLAACCTDRSIYVFDHNYKRKFTLKGHNAIPTCLDFDRSSNILQSNDANKELLFWDCKHGKQITNAFSLRNTHWATWSCVLGWYVSDFFCLTFS